MLYQYMYYKATSNLNGTLTISKPYLFEISHKILSIYQYNQTYTSYPLYYH